ncbi:MAG: hydrolase [Bdellovibrionales bacterium RIFOXYC1_FULL_54_43]|nr:MAG: hydrolase [Bdellovibrionales bacterium RIFOXYC1_FULL_54_43]OFZ80741.1 MAG: hydrolase [Bdellovibrionales bacterium RIFOXYD1_FULL_55_31]
MPHSFYEKKVEITEGWLRLPGSLAIPHDPKGLVIFAHGSGSSRNSPRNIQVARTLNDSGLATLLFDLLSPSEAVNRSNIFDVPLLSSRLVLATKACGSWVPRLPIGYFGASTGAAAALWAASQLGGEISAVVCRGGRPDLAGPVLNLVSAATLLIVGGEDTVVLDLNREALARLSNGDLIVIPEATHLFEEKGALEAVAEFARRWFIEHFGRVRQQSVA